MQYRLRLLYLRLVLANELLLRGYVLLIARKAE